MTAGPGSDVVGRRCAGPPRSGAATPPWMLPSDAEPEDHVRHPRTRIAAVATVGALALGGAACADGDAGTSPGQEDPGTTEQEPGDDTEDDGGIGY